MYEVVGLVEDQPNCRLFHIGPVPALYVEPAIYSLLDLAISCGWSIEVLVECLN